LAPACICRPGADIFLDFRERPKLQTAGRRSAGILFDNSGEAWTAPSLPLAPASPQDGDFTLIHYAVAEHGFVYAVGIRDSLMVIFEPSSVSPQAAFAAFYEISARAPRFLILANPGTAGHPDRYEVFDNVIDGLRRLEEAADRGSDTAPPQWLQNPPGEQRLLQPPRGRGRACNRKSLSAIPRTRPRMKARAADCSVRLPRPLASISADDEWLGRLLSFWGAGRRGRRLPSHESLDALELLNMARGRAHIVDTAASNPAAYRFLLWGAVNSYGGGYANRTLGDMPAGLMRDDAIEDYRQVVATGVPHYHLISHIEKSLAFSYARLLLPLAQDGRRVDRLVVLINERRLPELGRP
jgi:hypothetical protein